MGLFYPDAGNFIALVGRSGDVRPVRRAKAPMLCAVDRPVRSINAPGFVAGIDFSDHRNYWAEGCPAPIVTDTALYRNPGYHEPDDAYEKPDNRRIAKVVQAVFAVLKDY